jgi:RNA-binding protein YlmH
MDTPQSLSTIDSVCLRDHRSLPGYLQAHNSACRYDRFVSNSSDYCLTGILLFHNLVSIFINMRIKRDKILSFVSDGEERAMLARVLDQAEIVLHHGRNQLTDFYDPYSNNLINAAIQQLNLTATSSGGYPGAERQRLVLHLAEAQVTAVDFDFGFISIAGNFKYSRVSHRDFLGALLGLGLKRGKFGDIIVLDDRAIVVVAREIAPYLKANLCKVGRTRVHVSELKQDELPQRAISYREIKSTVSALRLDAVAAAGFGTSRSKITREIEAEKISINWRVCPSPKTMVKQGDVISARGKGRVILAAVQGQLKSGRIGILLHRLF